MGDEDGGGNDGLPPPPPPPLGAADDQSPYTPLVIAGADGRPVDPNDATQVLKKAPDKIDVGTLQTLLLTLTAAVAALTADVASLKNTHPSASGDAFKAANTGGITSTVKQLIFGPGTTLGTPTPDDRREARDEIASLELPDKCKDLVLKSKVPRCKDRPTGAAGFGNSSSSCGASTRTAGSSWSEATTQPTNDTCLPTSCSTPSSSPRWPEQPGRRPTSTMLKTATAPPSGSSSQPRLHGPATSSALRHKKRLMNIKQGAAESVVAYGKRALRIIDTLATLDCTVPDEDASLASLSWCRWTLSAAPPMALLAPQIDHNY